MARFWQPTRRDVLRHTAVGVTGASVSGWLGALAAGAPKGPAPSRSVILLWLTGGPSTIDMWDLKPGHANGGPFKEIGTAVSGVRISEHLPKLAKWTKDMAIVRSMSTKEGDHGRASFLLRTGYTPQASIQFPALGSLVATEIGREGADLPNFVSIASNRSGVLGGGFLGPHHAPLLVGEGATGPSGLTVPDLHGPGGVTTDARAARVGLLEGLDKAFVSDRGGPVATSIRAASARAVRLMRPEAAAAFRLDDEPEATRDAYGRGLFGQGCLLARRLVERGVPFVEVSLDGWDTHQDNFERVRLLSGQVDAAYSSLLADLKDRGRLGSTLVVCQGEFGRTPKINGNAGRDHWPQSWAVALAGGAVKGGQVLGRTNDAGTDVTDRPVTVPDLIATVVKSVGIDPTKQNMSNVGRPIRIADPSAKPIKELL
ncbi:DUF1501 domain-containing protein [Frigoriglobus tundricola]|uniref:Uncharacterized DUF1501 protein, type 2 n=1 Tax=Frigoriglobus tundricola TaxID=2774151 RepID=A0A6M5YI60_9BACT|nr:DUF1501 domain-containing protein [Frigoriglobus tundricola]QJW93737.1 Uncharacterized DUF1501 protein, type 2 [Frigoriglobus tundricola]